jgi:hypothetical protein
LCICQYFHETSIFWNPPIFSWDANILESAKIFMRRQYCGICQYFHETPIFWKSAYICVSANNLWICLIFVAANICVYFQYLFMHLSMHQYFWCNRFNLRCKIDVVLMIIWIIVIIINFVFTL